jgi:hypothetical protein
MDDRQNLSQPESVITTTEKSPSRNLQKKTCTAESHVLAGSRISIATPGTDCGTDMPK